jgi:hypothetical protein
VKQGCRRLHPPPLATGEQPDRPVEQVGEAERLGGLGDRRTQGAPAEPGEAAEEPEVLPDGGDRYSAISWGASPSF